MNKTKISKKNSRKIKVCSKKPILKFCSLFKVKLYLTNQILQNLALNKFPHPYHLQLQLLRKSLSLRVKENIYLTLPMYRLQW